METIETTMEIPPDMARIMRVAETAGRLVLENGGEIYRVEDIIERFCRAYGINYIDTFVTPSVMIISVKSGEYKTQITTSVRRIKDSQYNLEKINLVNDLSRKLSSKKLDLDYVEKELQHIDDTTLPYPHSIKILASGFIAASFSVIFGGGALEFIFGFIMGCLIRMLVTLLHDEQVNPFFVNITGGMTSTLLSLIFGRVGLISNPDALIIGSIMLLVPGMLFTNGIRDIIAGDLFSGIIRTLEAVFIAVALAIGSAIVYNIYFYLIGGIL